MDAEQGKRGKWNPLGSGDFRFVDTYVNRVCYEDGYCSYQKHEDPMIQAIVNGKKNYNLFLTLLKETGSYSFSEEIYKK